MLRACKLSIESDGDDCSKEQTEEHCQYNAEYAQHGNVASSNSKDIAEQIRR